MLCDFSPGQVDAAPKSAEVTKRPADTHKRTKQEHKARPARETKGFQRLPVRWVSGTLRGPATTSQTVGNQQPIVSFEYRVALVPAASAYMSNLHVSLVLAMFGALAEFERSLIRERTQAGLAAAGRAGRTGGRPPKLTDDDIEAAKAMLANPDIGVTQIAHRLGVSPATLYRYIPAARTANTPGV
jgi:Helix-turn-helix domain of resolvase/Resolvase, N terminal domain